MVAIVAVAVVVVVALVVGAVVLVGGGGGGDQASAKDREVLLESTATAGTAPFTPDLQPVTATTSTSLAPATTVPTTLAGAGALGPFGGTGNNSLCDREQLIGFLTDPTHAAVAKEWARVLSVRVVDIPTFVRALIPTTLTSDVRITNHRWENGRAVGYQAVLERGTAVLVDTNGRLVARCRCGNPLLPPQEVPQPIYTGPKWSGFDPTVIVVVVPSRTPIFPPGGVGTLPRPTTSTTRRPTGSTTSTTVLIEPDEAVARVRKAFEGCARTVGGADTFSQAEIDQILAGTTYVPTLTDQRTATYRVVVTIAHLTLGSGTELIGDSATWDISLLTGDLTPVDANAQAAGASCPALA
ncbi:MAG: DUF6777 domain-containing protein [Actinomycetes bacterium]